MTSASDYARIADLVATQGYAVVEDFLPVAMIATLAQEAQAFRATGQMCRAGVGKAAEASVSDDLRGDFIHWLEAEQCSPAQHAYLDGLEILRQQINRSLYLGLFDFEGHFAIYPPGAFYRKHLDQFQQDSRRALTCILYLNQEWQEADGGKLRLYLEESGEGESLAIAPRGGTLVTFLSSRFWHEVLPATKERLSITGWFRTRGKAVL
jgi:SM-20-related protein